MFNSDSDKKQIAQFLNERKSMEILELLKASDQTVIEEINVQEYKKDVVTIIVKIADKPDYYSKHKILTFPLSSEELLLWVETK